MNRHRQLTGFVLYLLTLIGCAQSVAGPTDSETHFLHDCKDRCDDPLACICGVCTQVCDDDESCGAFPGDATCVAPELLEEIRDCEPSDPIDESVCDVGCKSDSDCKALGRGVTCQSGFCRESGTPEAGSFEKADAGQGEADVVVDDLSEVASLAFTEQGVVLPQFTRVEPSRQMDASNPEPEPLKVILGGLAPTERAPKPGEAQPNAYGEPGGPLVVGVRYLGFRDSGEFGLTYPYDYLDEYADLAKHQECESSNYEWINGAKRGLCVSYYACRPDCVFDADCDGGGSGNAEPVCDIYTECDESAEPGCVRHGGCELRCNQETTCPEGMACVTWSGFTGEAGGGSISRCYWPRDVLTPECPAWCEQDPLPQGCSGSCASKGLSCGEQAGDCCDGLVCGAEGFCVEEV